MQPYGAPPEPWQVLADTLLQRQALICRLGDGLLPHDFAGLYVDADEVDRVLRTLPGLAGPGPARPAHPDLQALYRSLRPALASAREAFIKYLTGDSPFAAIVRSAGLTTGAAETLAVLAAVELSPHRMRLVAYVQDNVQLSRLTLATMAVLAADDDPIEESTAGIAQLAPDAPLIRSCLVEVTADGPWATRICSVPPRVIWALAGDNAADPDLPAGAVRPVPRPSATGRSTAPAPELLLVTGPDRASRQDLLARRWPGRASLVSAAPGNAAEWAAVVREATVADLVVVLEVDDNLPATAGDRIAAADHLTWVLSSAREIALDALPPLRWTEVRVADGFAGEDDWQAALGIAPDPAYRLTRDQLRLVTGACAGNPDRLAEAVRRLAGGHLEGLAIRIRPRRTWADLVLPDDKTRQLRELTARYRGRSTVYQRWGFPPVPATGVVGLFSGPSGTGKTLAAEIVAGDLGLDLYKIDLSAVVSKYIGETEKNLERIFGAATAGELVLFFDEADALFGKRSEVSDAHDRYANIEVAYLLQRLEAYDGLVVLATNLQRNIDDAFLRRISVAVNFDAPDEPQRRAMWQRVFPPQVPLGPVDIDFLSRQFDVTGGIIHNAALTAAFLAADEGGEVSMERIVLALGREFQKLGRLRTQAEFDRYFHLVNGGDDAAPAR